MAIVSINPWTLETIDTFEATSSHALQEMVVSGHEMFKKWSALSIATRCAHFERIATILDNGKTEYAKQITLEMGKPINEAIAEIEKCAWVCRYYATNAEDLLTPRTIQTEAAQSYVRYDPLGLILAIMPWNFPFWQVFRFAAPTLLAGNTALLKHAPNVSGCAKLIVEILSKAGIPNGVFQSVLLENEATNELIKNPLIKAVSLTGSEKAGEAVAGTAGKYLKPSLLELGGSNAIIVLDDADIPRAIDVAFKSRFLNAGQSCIAGKRFLIASARYDEFVDAFVEKMRSLRCNDPLKPETELGPLARVDLAEKLEEQVYKSIEMGAKLLIGGRRQGACFEATALSDVTEHMPVFKEETFGPVAPFMRIRDLEEGILLSNASPFGLGVSIFTQNLNQVLAQVHRFEEGAVFINELVKSDPRLPFGGVGRSGYGRELAAEGIRAFVNVKTVYVA